MRSDLNNVEALDRPKVDPANTREELRLFREVVQQARSEAVPVSTRAVEQASAGEGTGSSAAGYSGAERRLYGEQRLLDRIAEDRRRRYS
jgi:mevalonate kinase